MRYESQPSRPPTPHPCDEKRNHEECGRRPRPRPGSQPQNSGRKKKPKNLPAPRQKHLATRRRKGSPQQRGLTPPLGLERAIETPPARKGRKKEGASPEARRLTTEHRARRKESDSAVEGYEGGRRRGPRPTQRRKKQGQPEQDPPEKKGA